MRVGSWGQPCRMGMEICEDRPVYLYRRMLKNASPEKTPRDAASLFRPGVRQTGHVQPGYL